MTKDSDPQFLGMSLKKLRDHAIQALELCSSFEKQRTYQKRVPVADVPGEVFQTWHDFMDTECIEEMLKLGVCNQREARALLAFNSEIKLIAEAIPILPRQIEVAQALPEWIWLSSAAATALQAFESEQT